jgi:hypothetical protein
MKGRRSSVRGVVLPSGRVLVVTGTFCSLPGGGVAFLGLLLPKRRSVRGAAVALEKLLKGRVSVDRLTALRVLRPSSS